MEFDIGKDFRGRFKAQQRAALFGGLALFQRIQRLAH